MRTTFLCPVYNSYLIFRANIESLMANIKQYKLIIVDDCSDDLKLIEFLKYLSTLPNITVIKGGDPADCPHPNIYNNICPRDRNKFTLGQGLAINLGLQHINTEFAFIFDSDIFFMPHTRSLIVEMEKCMDLNNQIMAVGQLVGQIDGIKIIDSPFYATVSNRIEGGFSNACAMLSRMSGWTENGLSKLHNGGWCHEPYSKSIFNQGFKTCNFNVFKDRYLIHLGAGVLRTERPHEYAGNFAFTQDKHRKYGTLNHDGSLKDYYAGYHCVPFTTNDFIKLLTDTYAKLDFNIRKDVTINW